MLWAASSTARVRERLRAARGHELKCRANVNRTCLQPGIVPPRHKAQGTGHKAQGTWDAVE